MIAAKPTGLARKHDSPARCATSQLDYFRSLGLEIELVNDCREDNLQEDPKVEKERETKDDGRYIIFYTFEDEED
jgi:hypothetical protein